MKIIQRIKNYVNFSIISKIEIKKTNKSECDFFIESLTKDGDIVSTRADKISLPEIRKTLTSFETKMKKCAFLNETPIYEGCEVETILFINPELMEKERVGFEFYGPISDKSANINICAYYSFGETGQDFRQPLTHDEIFGFFRLSNFESSAGGFKATLNEYGVTYTDIEGTVNNVMVLTTQEYERQFKREVVPEPKKRTRKVSALPSEVKELQKILFSKIEEKVELKEEEKVEEINKDEAPVKKGRGRPAKIVNENSTEENIVNTEETPQIKRGRGRPLKNKQGE